MCYQCTTVVHYLIYLGLKVTFNTLYRSYHDGSFVGRGNQYIQLLKVLYCKLPTNCKQLPVFPLEVGSETKLQSQRWEARVLPLCHRGFLLVKVIQLQLIFNHSAPSAPHINLAQHGHENLFFSLFVSVVFVGFFLIKIRIHTSASYQPILLTLCQNNKPFRIIFNRQ